MARVALITGGTRGIGGAISKALLAQGMRVGVNYHTNEEEAQLCRDRLGVPVFKWDVGNFEACQDGIAKVTADVGDIDILVNNAGITRDGFLHRLSIEDWAAVMRTNLDSVFNMTRGVMEGMRKRSFGRIVSIASVNAQMGQLGQANYSAAKAGVIGFTKAIAREGARRGITANVVAPGYVDTDMVQALPQETIDRHILPTIPVGRLGEADEIGRCVAFLASDDAGYITGSTISVNGGKNML